MPEAQKKSNADHWPTYSWRPAIGFAFAIIGVIAALIALLANVGVIFFQADKSVLEQLPATLAAFAAIMGVIAPVIGVASWWRGKMQAANTTVSNVDQKG